MYMLLILTVLVAKSILLFIRLRRMAWIMPIVLCVYPSLLVALLLTNIIRTPERYLQCIMLFIHCRRNCWIFRVLITQKKRWSLSSDVPRCRKGPEYFVEAAALVLQRTRNIRFVMAGSGDMLNAMINLVWNVVLPIDSISRAL